MDPNEEPNIDTWANSEALDGDVWNPNWDEFIIDWPDPSPQLLTDTTTDCNWQMDTDDLLNLWETVLGDAVEANRVSELFQVVIPLAVVGVLER